jgi:hypothetical protein
MYQVFAVIRGLRHPCVRVPKDTAEFSVASVVYMADAVRPEEIRFVLDAAEAQVPDGIDKFEIWFAPPVG